MTMATCPDGHQSVATDYCDECGLSIGAPAPIPTAVNTSPSPSPYGSAGEPCPNCLLPRQGGDTFCEGCGFDFANEQPAPTLTAPTQPGSGSTGTPGPALDPGFDQGNSNPTVTNPNTTNSGPTGQGNAPVGPAPTGPGTATNDPVIPAPDPATTTGWVAIASADRAYYDAVVAEGEIDPTAYPFPAYCPDRHYPLNGQAVRIGRSGKRGPVEIDLSGPPTDPGVSHLHAVLQQRPDGGWSVIDLESMNGTVLNNDTAPIPPNQAFPVELGHRIHVGVWTTLTLIQTD